MARSPFDATAVDYIAGTAIITLCLAAAAYIPIPGVARFLLLPLPVIFYHVRFGGQVAAIVSMLSILIISGLFIGLRADTILMAGMLAHGWLLGKYVKNHIPVAKAIAYSTATVFSGAVLLIFALGNFSGTGALDLVSEYTRENLAQTIALYNQVDTAGEDGSGKTSRILEESFDTIHYALLVIMPAITAATLAITAWINLLLGRIVLKAAGFHSPVMSRLNLWQAPDGLVWGVIGCALLLFVPFQALNIVALNILIVVMMVYLFQGFAIISFYLDKKEVPVIIRVFIYAALAIQQFLLILVIGLGFFDTWLDIRRINIGDSNQLSS